MSEGSINIGGMDMVQEIKSLKDKIRELESKICDHDWQNYTILENHEAIGEADGKQIVRKVMNPTKICNKCYIVRSFNPNEVKEFEQALKTQSNLIVPPEGNSGLITPGH